MYIYTTSRTSDRRAQRGLPLRQLLVNFSTGQRLLGEFQHRFGRRPRRRVGIDRVAIASSAWRKLCSSSLVEMLVGVSDANSKRATAVATHSKSVATSLMVRPGAGRLRWPAREELRPRPERGGWGRSSRGPTTSVASAPPAPALQHILLPRLCTSALSRVSSCERGGAATVHGTCF
jgi:hypothetical protein